MRQKPNTTRFLSDVVCWCHVDLTWASWNSSTEKTVNWLCGTWIFIQLWLITQRLWKHLKLTPLPLFSLFNCSVKRPLTQFNSLNVALWFICNECLQRYFSFIIVMFNIGMHVITIEHYTLFVQWSINIWIMHQWQNSCTCANAHTLIWLLII